MIYIFLFGLFSFFGLLDIIKSKRKIDSIILPFLAIILISVGGIRWETGTDWQNYYNYFDLKDSFLEFILGGFEPGFSLLNYLIKNLFGKYTFMLFSCTLLSISFYFLYFNKLENKYFVILAFLCYYLGAIFATRQVIALGITAYSTLFIINKKKTKFILTVLFASCFHITSLIFLFAYTIFHKKNITNLLVVILFLSIIIGYFEIIPKLFLKGLLSIFTLLDLPVFKWKVISYLEKDAVNQNVNPIVALIIGFVKRLMLLPLFLFFKRRILEKDQNYNGYLNLWLAGNILYFLVITSLTVLNRLTVYYVFYEIVLLSSLLLGINKRSKLLYFSLFMIFLSLRYVLTLQAYWEQYIPYKSIFNL